MIYRKSICSPLGNITLAGDGEMLLGLWFEGQAHYGGGFGRMAPANLPVFTITEDWLRRYFDGQRPDPRKLPLSPIGSPFRQRVWAHLLKIPYGQVTTYGEIAKALDCKSPQAVGGAVGHNPISIIIPCHRVVGSNGKLTGYAGGIEKKAYLLELERSSSFLPERHK